MAAGEDIRIIPVTDTWPVDVPDKDFWLIDSRDLFHLRYADTGAWLGAVRVTDPAMVVEACFARDAAWHQATPWVDYLTAHPSLLQRVPKGV
ncbi:MAG: hypothetical protein JO272_17690 [Pseudonocardiales bacterium]|nr:hypothetical protein [Pseudonocardiales bacterium]